MDTYYYNKAFTFNEVWCILWLKTERRGYMSETASPITLRAILEKYAAIESAEHDWLPKRQHTYRLFRRFTSGNQAGFSINLRYCPDFDPIKWFNEKEISLPEGFLLTKRKNIVIQVDIWNERVSKKSSRKNTVHYIPLTELDRLFELRSIIETNSMFENHLERKGFGKPEQLSEEFLREAIKLLLGEYNEAADLSLLEIFISAYHEDFQKRGDTFFSHVMVKELPKDEYRQWSSLFTLKYQYYSEDGQIQFLPWKMSCISAPRKKRAVKGENGREMALIWDYNDASWIDLYMNSSDLEKAISSIQIGIENWFNGSLIEKKK